MSLYDPNDICPTCGGLQGYAGARRKAHACKCPDPFLAELEAEWAKEQAAQPKRKTLSIVTRRAA